MDTDTALLGAVVISHPESLVEVLQDVEIVDNTLPNRSSCWQDVISAIETAKAQDGAKAEKSILRSRLRKSGPEVAVLEALAGMIPDQDGLSILRGGLMTLFKMVTLRLETRTKILRAFEGIPQTFLDAVEAGMRFPNALDLLHAVRQLYNTLVEDVATLIRILLRSHPHKNRLVRLWKQRPGKEADVVEECLLRVSQASERVDRCSRAAMERAVGEILVLNDGMSADVKALKSGMDGIQATIDDGVTRLESRLAITGQDKHFQAVMEKVADRVLEGIRGTGVGWYWPGFPGPTQQPALPWLVTAAVSPSLLAPASPLPQIEQAPHPAPHSTSPRARLHDVLNALNVPDSAVDDALEEVIRRSYRLKNDTGAPSSRLLETERFTRWLKAPATVSDLVLVDGQCGNIAAAKVSPMSAICAFLVETIMNIDEEDHTEQPSPVVLHHFCGQHLGQRNPLSGPVGLIRSFVHQLLVGSQSDEDGTASSSPPLEFVDMQLLSAVDAGDVPSLCRLFCELFSHLDRSRPVFCVIDGVSDLETALDGWGDDACHVGGMLLGLVDSGEHRPGPALKVLLTSAQKSTALAESVVPPDRHISLLAAHSTRRRSYTPMFQRDVEALLMAGNE
ncbi:uncharacterized protein C8A04DRAFT_32938 [Dichotomopilus funicola]|uniref:Uncharacterized protein n=1 Tax=Dichotomopilus funicola TaxID=1934379 RepID=A0AAN6ZHN7_9PEZI|nr:hypothetical protein C8A04DRAFT_32938 [Dichotomopilus funicola]